MSNHKRTEILSPIFGVAKHKDKVKEQKNYKNGGDR